MTHRNDEILNWVLDKIRARYAQDVALLVIYGSWLTGHTDEWSDIDFFFVPTNKQAFELSTSFIIEGIGFDLFPISWERLERIAAFEETLSPLLDNSQIRYVQMPEHEQRFLAIRDRLRTNLADHGFMHTKAQKKWRELICINEKLKHGRETSNCRLLSGKIILGLADIIAWENGTYLKNGIKTLGEDLDHMEILPGKFLHQVHMIIQANDTPRIQERCREILDTVRQTFDYSIQTEDMNIDRETSVRNEQEINYEELAGWYREVISTFNKVHKYCRNKDIFMAFISAVSLQQTLNEDIQGLRYDVLSSFNSENLSALAHRTSEVEKAVTSLIEKHVPIRRYASFDAFLRENPA